MQARDHLESGLIPTWEAAPCIRGFKLCYCHVLLLAIELIHTIKKKKKMCCEYAASFIYMNLRLSKNKKMITFCRIHASYHSEFPGTQSSEFPPQEEAPH